VGFSWCPIAPCRRLDPRVIPEDTKERKSHVGPAALQRKKRSVREMIGKGLPKIPENDDTTAPREQDTGDGRLMSFDEPAWRRSESLTIDRLRRRVAELLYGTQKEPGQAAPRDGVSGKGGEADNS
jgi:hypothetical protein